jgi:hypothetical protein
LVTPAACWTDAAVAGACYLPKNDLIVTPAGGRIYPAYFVRLHDGHDGIGQFQIEQPRPGDLLQRFCAPQAMVDRIAHAVRPRLQNDLGSDMNLQVHRGAVITRSRIGKHRSVIELPVE